LSSIQDAISLGEIQVEGRFVDASNATLFAKCNYQDLELAIIYKPIAGERPLWDFPDGNLAQREVAAYELSRVLKLDLVPFTILRDGPFGPGMVQEWIEIDEELEIVDLANGHHPKIRQMALFDAIINNTDRKYGHILPTKSGEIFGCDHGVTFHEEPKLRTVLWQFAGKEFSEEEFQILQQSFEIGPLLLGELITSAEIAALIARVQELLKLGTFPFPNPDWPAVPWPPF
jgi:hypothetical protein